MALGKLLQAASNDRLKINRMALVALQPKKLSVLICHTICVPQ